MNDTRCETPGLVDLQVNGFAGIDFNTPGITAEALDHALQAMAETGVVACLPTLITAPAGHLADCFADLERAARGSRLAMAMVLGYHLEGPFLSPQDGYRGCHPASAMGAADIVLFDRLNAAAGDRIRLLTVAPEVEGALALIAHARTRGVAVALGHTAADRATIDAAVAAGATLSTHLGNGSPQVMPRNDNVVLSQLGQDGLSASFIADGLHIPPSTLRVYLRAKELKRSVLVTDATAGAAAPPGNYRLGPVPIRALADGSVREAGAPRLAGAARTMDCAVANIAEWLGLPLPEAVRLAHDNPLTVLGLPAGAGGRALTWRKADGRWRLAA
ncbi:MAG: N-acetylglucosamine-6-phosphate deacetylase [Rhodospirillales bacterium]|nr:N-acetylglucosamine-6-phosphate deacetylase [Rhodospirillales bacterium]